FPILLGTVLFGITTGNSLMMHPLLLAERFGTRDYGRIYSTSQLMTMVGVAGCPTLIGLLYEASGGYAVPFLVATGLTLVGLAVLALFGEPTPLAVPGSLARPDARSPPATASPPAPGPSNRP